MKITFRLAPLVLAAVSAVGCSGGQTPDASANLTPGQEASAKVLGISTPGGVAHGAGPYQGQVNMAQNGVANQQKRVDAENAAVGAIEGKLH